MPADRPLWTVSMIGHPVVRGWHDRHGVRPGRVSPADPDVVALLRRLGAEATDLGGSSGLNLALTDRGQVLSVHEPFVSRQRLLDERALRTWLAGRGVTVGRPVATLLRCGPRWAELEEFVSPGDPLSDPAELFAAIGRLHRILADAPVVPVRPFTATVGTPRTLRRWFSRNEAAGYPGAVPEILPLLARLARRWRPLGGLPHMVVHGDAHPDNIRRSAYLDFSNAAMAPRVFDLAYARAHLLMGAASALPLGAYEDAAGWRITADEREALLPLTASVLLYYDICGWGAGPFLDITAQLLA